MVLKYFVLISNDNTMNIRKFTRYFVTRKYKTL